MNYFYNGVELPALPEWDREMYPYAYIMGFTKSTGISYDFVVCANPLTYKKPFLYDYYVVSVYGNGGLFDLDDGEWVLWRMDEPLDKGYKADEIPFLWTNHDVLNTTDGSVYLAASDPIPVSAPQFDPLSLFMGWKAGNWVARQRGKA